MQILKIAGIQPEFSRPAGIAKESDYKSMSVRSRPVGLRLTSERNEWRFESYGLWWKEKGTLIEYCMLYGSMTGMQIENTEE